MFGKLILGGIIGVGAVIAIKLLLDEEEESRKSMYRARSDFSDSVNRYERKVKNERKHYKNSIRFQELHSAYVESIELSGIAYGNYQGLKKTVSKVYSVIKSLNKEKNKLKNVMNNRGISRQEKNELLKAVRIINGRITRAYNSINEIEIEKDNALNRLKNLNIQTAGLRKRIANETGKGGRVWYQRLQERKQNI